MRSRTQDQLDRIYRFTGTGGDGPPDRARVETSPASPAVAWPSVPWGLCPPPPRGFSLWANSMSGGRTGRREATVWAARGTKNRQNK
jgi:hypothetical protein